MADRAVTCKKCKKKVFYIPKEYSMNISVTCTNCHDSKPKSIQTAAANYAKVRKGKRPDVHPTYSFRSATEANFARILNYLGLEWKFEERVFTFPDRKIKPFIYVMDFEILKGNQEFKEGFVEVKGYMRSWDRQKLRLLKKYYPEEFKQTYLILYNKYKKADIQFCEKQGYKYMFYDELTAKFKDKIKFWE